MPNELAKLHQCSIQFGLVMPPNVLANSLRREALGIWREPTKVTDTFIMVTHNVQIISSIKKNSGPTPT